jgi:hypothetical protein
MAAAVMSCVLDPRKLAKALTRAFSDQGSHPKIDLADPPFRPFSASQICLATLQNTTIARCDLIDAVDIRLRLSPTVAAAAPAAAKPAPLRYFRRPRSIILGQLFMDFLSAFTDSPTVRLPPGTRDASAPCADLWSVIKASRTIVMSRYLEMNGSRIFSTLSLTRMHPNSAETALNET